VVTTIVWLRNIRSPKYLVELYMMSMGYGSDRTLKEGSMKHNSSPIVHGVGTLDSVPSGARSNETKTLH